MQKNFYLKAFAPNENSDIKFSPKNLKSITDYFQRKIKPIAENAFFKKLGVSLESSSQMENSECPAEIFADKYEFREETLLYSKTSVENNNCILIKGYFFRNHKKTPFC